MESRSSYDWSSIRVKDEEDTFPEYVEEHIKEEEPTTVRIMLLREVKLTVTGSVTKQEYKFYGAGSACYVDKADAPELLSKVRGQSCCGGSSPQPYFVRG